MISFLSQPWPWYVSGPLIALVMFLMLWMGERFGVSSTLRSYCAIAGAGKNSAFFDFDWKKQRWNIVFVIGAIIGGFISGTFLDNPEPLNLSQATIKDLEGLGIAFDGSLAPESLFSWSALSSLKSIVVLVVGGFFIGFGARWAGGCTSGHAISGLSNLQLPSLIAVIGFFIGGLLMTFLIMPLIFS